MILPNVRASFGPAEVELVSRLLRQVHGSGAAGVRDRLESEGLDEVLDDPRVLNALMSAGGISAAPLSLVFYLLVRHSLLEDGLDDLTLADYLAALLLDFGRRDRAHKVEDTDGEAFYYLVDLIQALEASSGRRAFLLNAHLGNLAHWLSGVFPDHITARVQRRGAPGLDYYETIGAAGFRSAAESRDAEDLGLDHVLRSCAISFPALRTALNRIADRYLFGVADDPVERLLRQVADRFRIRPESSD
jgi:hypothetical protein